MEVAEINGGVLHWREDGGDIDDVPVVFANSLGTDLRLWDPVLPYLPKGFRYIRYDKRGHGLSYLPDGPFSMDDLIADAAGLIEKLGLSRVIFVGLSVGGMIGQGLAAQRPDLLRALVASNTAPRVGTQQDWQTRMDTIRRTGLASMAPMVMERWFGSAFRNTSDVSLWQTMFARNSQAGYLATCAAIAQSDLTEQTKTLTLPTLAISGSDDGACPAALTRQMAAMIPGAEYGEIAGAGHLPCAERPQEYAKLLTPFLEAQRGA